MRGFLLSWLAAVSWRFLAGSAAFVIALAHVLVLARGLLLVVVRVQVSHQSKLQRGYLCHAHDVVVSNAT